MITVIYIQVLLSVEHFLTSWETTSFSRMAQLHGVSHLIHTHVTFLEQIKVSNVQCSDTSTAVHRLDVCIQCQQVCTVHWGQYYRIHLLTGSQHHTLVTQQARSAPQPFWVLRPERFLPVVVFWLGHCASYSTKLSTISHFKWADPSALKAGPRSFSGAANCQLQ